MRHIPLMVPYVPEVAVQAVTEVLRTRWIGQGPKVVEFEKVFSEYIGKSSVAVGSCTDALHLAYILSGIGPDDEVIAPLFTCTATNIPLLYLGANIKFADVEPGSLNVSMDTIRPLITRKTKAVVVVHYGGMPVKDLAAIQVMCWERGITLIEDCAQALVGHTSLYSRLGSLGDFACFSFQAVKHVGTGDGGMLVLNDPRLVEKAKRIRWFGIDRAAKLKGVWENDIWEVGYKYQMNDITAAMGIVGMECLREQIVHRQRLRLAYMDGLNGLDGIQLLDTDPDSACWLCTVLVDRREDFKRKLAEHGIESDQTHYRNDRYTIFSQYRGTFPNMDAIDPKYLVLPLHMGMTGEDVEYICSVIRSGW